MSQQSKHESDSALTRSAKSTAVLVTGCSSGIGRESALALMHAGLPTWASARRLQDIEDLKVAGCETVELDVTDEACRVRAVRAVESRHGAVGTLVNNAGYGQVGPIEELSLESLERQFATNVFGVIRMCQLVLPAMRAQRSGTIIIIGAAAGHFTLPCSGAYSMTKYALEALADSLRFEVARFGVRVVLLEPGQVQTSFVAKFQDAMPRLGGPYDAFKKNTLAMIDPSRGIRAGDVARVVVRATRAREPRTRYKIGVDRRVFPKLRLLLGDRLWDAMMRKMVRFD